MMTDMLNNLHFLRPQWFYAFIPLAVFLIILMKNQTYSESWRKICDARLLPFILTAKQGKRSILPALLTFLGASLCITALAGPVYKKLQQPVFREQAALVILLDLSQSMNATDIKPSRIERAKLELLDILKQRKGGQTALIVYAANAFTVTPLTDDNNTISNLLPVLQTSMMPAQGSNLGQALDKAHSLFTQAGITQGDILIVTDGIHSRFRPAIKEISAQGYRVSIFGIGTAQGSPVPLDSGFLLNASGAIVIPKLKINKLRKIAHEGGGIYVGVTADNSDTNALTHLFSSRANNAIRNNQIIMTDLHADRWREDGVWLLLPLLLIAALWTRKGWLVVFIIFLLPLPQPGYAAESAVNTAQKTTSHATSHSPFSLHNLSLDNLWLTPDQKAIRAFRQGKNNEAAKNFTNPEWKASALYRSGKYEQAAKFFEQASNRDKKQANSSSNDLYNQGNALAKAGKYPQAIAAYNKAISLNKNNKDAAYNRKLVKKALQKQQQQQKKSGKQSNSNKKSSQQGNKNQQGGKQNASKKNNSGKGNKQNAQQKNSAGQQGKQGQQQKQKQSQQSANAASQNGNKQNNTARNQSHQGSNKNEQKRQDEAMKKRHPGDAQSKKEKQEQQALKQAEKDQKNPPQGKQGQSNQLRSNQPRPNQSQPGNRKTQEQKQAGRSAENNMTEDQKATEQWLRRIPDDPGGLLRRKFLYQYQQLPNQHDSKQPW